MYEGDVFDKNRNVFERRVVYNIKNENFEKQYEILYVLEFDSVRKRMSIIVKNQESNEYFLYCKGADSSISPRCTCKTFSLYEDSLKEFSEKGWRTLVIAYKPLTKSEFESYSQMLDEANSDILNKEEKLNKSYDLIESNLRIIGVTSVEDRLQEDVEGTLFALRQAGIKIWILTGDKLETAVNISDSCKHFSREMFKFVLKNLKTTDEIEENFSIINEQ